MKQSNKVREALSLIGTSDEQGEITCYRAAAIVGVSRQHLYKAWRDERARADKVCPTCGRKLDDNHKTDIVEVVATVHNMDRIEAFRAGEEKGRE